MVKEMSVRPDRPMGQAGQWRPVEAAEMARVEGGFFWVVKAIAVGVAAVGTGIAYVVKKVVD